MASKALNFVYGAIVASFLFISAAVYILILRTGAETCIVEDFSESQKLTFEVLDGIVNLGMTLSTGIVGLGAALLVGAYGNITITRSILFSSFVSIISLSISVLYGIWWKMGIANIWFNECPNLIGSRYMQDINAAHFYYMMIGVAFIGVTVGAAALRRI